MSVFDKLEQINKEHNDFLRSRQNYEIPEDDVFSDEIISEKIDDLKTTIAKPLKRHVKALLILQKLNLISLLKPLKRLILRDGLL